jgi:hypothetical protein
MPKGRQTIRKGGSALADGASMRLWEFDAEPGSTLAALFERAYEPALAAIDKFDEHRSTAGASGRFTEAGLMQDAQQFALRELTPILHRGRQHVAAAKREIAEKRSKLTLQPIDRTDLVGEMRRAEMRAFLRSMPDDQRRSYVAANLEHLDPEMALAIVSAPPELSGVLGSDRAVLVDRALAAQHGDAIKEVIELERAADIASFAVEAVRTEIARDVGVVDPVEFDRLAQPFEKGGDQPRLKKFVERDGNGDQVEVVRKLRWNEDRSTGGSWTRATAEEIAAATYIESAS